MSIPLLTIFTPTYNRAHTLPRLLESLKSQTVKNFEWLVVNDGSKDNTSEMIASWLKEDHGFAIKYIEVENGGKNRAINTGLMHASGIYFMILDSDDLLKSDAVSFVCEKMEEVEDDDSFIGISGKKADYATGRPVGLKDEEYSEEGYIDCSNLDRGKYRLLCDMAEVFFTEKLRKYKFEVWPGEKFTPEEVVWNQIALDGYKLRWFNKITYLCEYQEDGLTKAVWKLIKANPMGYAMMWNHRLLYPKNRMESIRYATQYEVCCLMANEWKECFKCRKWFMGIAMMPYAILLAIKRIRLYNRMT